MERSIWHKINHNQKLTFEEQQAALTIAWYEAGSSDSTEEMAVIEETMNELLKEAAIQASENNHPPRFAEFAIWFFLPRETREVMIGDLEEEYHEAVDRFGQRAAALWYWKQCLTSIGPYLRHWAEKLVKFFGLEEIVRRFLL